MKRLLPAYPLFTKDPFFSIWSPDDILNKSDTIFWNGSTKKTFGRVVADGVSYIFLGKSDNNNLKQTDVRLTAYSTEYDFTAEDFDFTVRFISALPPENLEILSCPVCYVDYTLKPKKPLKNVRVMISLSEEYCYDSETAKHMPRDGMAGGVINGRKRETAWFGRKLQPVLSKVGDSQSADWGYFYAEGDEAHYHTYNTVNEIIDGKKPAFIGDDAKKMLTAVNNHSGADKDISGTILVGFDDIVSINYFGAPLKGYFFENGRTSLDALDFAHENIGLVKDIDAKTSANLKDAAKPYGDAYYTLLLAALRQSVAAHKLVKDNNGNLLFLSKECHSNGCIATVDVSYPSMPLYLRSNPELLRGMLEPIYKFAKLPCWEFDFAPHDAGCYPYCCGQVYGMNGCEQTGGDVYPYYSGGLGTFFNLYSMPRGNNLYNFDSQMPVEECSNMLIMTALYYMYSSKKDKAFLESNFELMEKWADYLSRHGLKPENQLCTDDFAGHLAKNINLSIKASLGLQAFSRIAGVLGKNDCAAKMDKLSRIHAKTIEDLYKGRVLPLAFDNDDGSYSLKYNLAIDVLFGSGLYSEELLEREVDCYIEKRNRFGTPLDTRADYTKSDWILWTALLTKDKNKARMLLEPISETPAFTEPRVPFTDWYDTKTAKQIGFQNRTVQGAFFILTLKR